MLSRTGTSGNFYDGINFRYSPYWQANGGVPSQLPLQTVRDGRMGSRLINTNYHDFAPRIGIGVEPLRQVVDPRWLRYLLFDGEQELHLARPRAGRPKGGR